MPDNSKPRRRWLQFGIATLLLLMLFIAGLFSGYRTGYQAGYEAGQQQREQETLVNKVYAVGDLLLQSDKDPANKGVATRDGSPADFDSMIDMITSTIEPSTWDTVGGPGSIVPYENNFSLVVSQTPSVHEKIVDLFTQLRRKTKGDCTSGTAETNK